MDLLEDGDWGFKKGELHELLRWVIKAAAHIEYLEEELARLGWEE